MTYPNDPNQANQQRSTQEEKILAREERLLVAQKAIQIVCFLVGSLELLFGLRFFLRLTGANQGNTFANAIYGISDPFISPFSTLFISPTANGSTNIFDVNLLVAMIAYFILMLLAIWFIQIIANR